MFAARIRSLFYKKIYSFFWFEISQNENIGRKGIFSQKNQKGKSRGALMALTGQNKELIAHKLLLITFGASNNLTTATHAARQAIGEPSATVALTHRSRRAVQNVLIRANSLKSLCEIHVCVTHCV